MMKKTIFRVMILSAILIPGSLPAGERIRLGEEEQTRAGIVVAPVLKQDFREQMRVVGQVLRSPGSTVTVKTVIGGRVESILATPGAAVKTGQPLLVLHSPEVNRLQSDMLQAVEGAKLAMIRLRAGEQLFEIEGISKIELEGRRQEMFSARLAADSLKAELRDLGYANSEIDAIIESSRPRPHLVISAPSTGVLLRLEVEEHEWVQAYAPLVVIGDPDRIELELQIPPDEASMTRAGDKVSFAPSGRPDLEGNAVVLASVPQVDPMTRTVVIRARITKVPRGIVPGIFVEGLLVHGMAKNAPAIPEKALSRIGGRDVVFVRIDKGLFEIRPVKLGNLNENNHEVLSGLRTGEELVVGGAFFLKSKFLKTSEGEQ